MNFLTSDYAYSLYGRETLQERVALYNLSANSRPREMARVKYEAQGWKTVAGEREAQAIHSFLPCGRIVGDHDTWIMRLGPPNSGDAYVRDACWDLVYNLNGDGLVYPG